MPRSYTNSGKRHSIAGNSRKPSSGTKWQRTRAMPVHNTASGSVTLKALAWKKTKTKRLSVFKRPQSRATPLPKTLSGTCNELYLEHHCLTLGTGPSEHIPAVPCMHRMTKAGKRNRSESLFQLILECRGKTGRARKHKKRQKPRNHPANPVGGPDLPCITLPGVFRSVSGKTPDRTEHRSLFTFSHFGQRSPCVGGPRMVPGLYVSEYTIPHILRMSS